MRKAIRFREKVTRSSRPMARHIPACSTKTERRMFRCSNPEAARSASRDWTREHGRTHRSYMPKQKVGQNQTTSSLALEMGFFWKDIWEHGENSKLKEKRKDPNVLFADDDIFIPEKVKKTVDKGSEAEHGFKRKGEPSKLKMKFLALDKSRANEKYVLKRGSQLINRQTDGDGKLEHFIPGNTKSAQVIFRD